MPTRQLADLALGLAAVGAVRFTEPGAARHLAAHPADNLRQVRYVLASLRKLARGERLTGHVRVPSTMGRPLVKANQLCAVGVGGVAARLATEYGASRTAGLVTLGHGVRHSSHGASIAPSRS